MTDGIGRIRAEQFWTEQVRLTPLTSDPGDTEEGELWLREDVAEEDDQLATVRLDTGGSTVDIPVFDLAADVPDDVSTQLRLVVDGQQGFVPTVEDAGSIPQLGVWSDGVRHEAIEELLAIPDDEVYLHDDWGDNQLTSDRDGGGETTHNGETGFYRPEWTVTPDRTEPSVSDEKIAIDSGDHGVHTTINLNLDETITWEFTDVDLRESGSDGTDRFNMVLFSETDNSDSSGRYAQSYQVHFARGGPLRLEEIDSSQNTNDFITTSDPGDRHDIKVTREPDGKWELIVDESSEGTGNDTTHTDPEYAAISGRDDVDGTMDEMKVF